MTDAFTYDQARDDKLVLVDEEDGAIGTATKEHAHREGLLHRAFSVVLERGIGSDRQFLVARRANGKYHSGGLWANSCCSHPRVGEDLPAAASRRVGEELGCGVANLREIGSFVYRAELSNDLVEHEYDHVFMGSCEGEPKPDPAEIAEVRWVSASELASCLREHPERFTAWAPGVFEIALST